MVGSRVEVRYQGGRNFFPGTVKEMNNENGTISVAYDDGDFEAAAPRLRVRFPGSRPLNPAPTSRPKHQLNLNAITSLWL